MAREEAYILADEWDKVTKRIHDHAENIIKLRDAHDTLSDVVKELKSKIEKAQAERENLMQDSLRSIRNTTIASLLALITAVASIVAAFIHKG